MKNSRAFIIIVLTIFLVPLMQCGETEVEAPLYSIDGTVTLPDGGLAPGALVYLTESASSTNYLAVTVADQTGSYSLSNIRSGDYFIFSNYDTENTNIGGRLSGLIFSSEAVSVSVNGANASLNVDLMNSAPAGVQVNTNTTWTIDQSHSEVVFEFPYREVNGTFSGRFDTYGFTFDFDDSDLANSNITAEISLLSIETGQPGRDGLFTTEASDGSDSLNANNEVVEWYSSGCLGNTLGSTTGRNFDTVLTANTTATWASSSIEMYGDGYKATGDLSFMGLSAPVDVYFKFIDGYISDGTQFSSMEANFKFNATSDHGLTASQVDDEVSVWATVQLRNTL